MSEKKPLACLFRENPTTPEGKYLVKRRDGTVVEWPSFVLGARDLDGVEALLFYALLKVVPPAYRADIISRVREEVALWVDNDSGQNKEYVQSVLKWAAVWEKYRAENGDGDPLMGAHRKDDPVTVEEMKKGMSS